MHDDYKKVIEQAEKLDNMTHEDVEDFVDKNIYTEMDRHLWQILVSTVRGPEAKSFVANPEDSGFKAWKQLTGRYHSRTCADKITAMRRLISPVSSFGQPKDVNHSRVLLQRWENELHEYETKYGRMGESEKIASAISLLPASLYGDNGVFRGQRFDKYEDLRKRIVDFMEDKTVHVSPKPLCDTNHVAEWEHSDAAYTHNTWQELNAMTKGKGQYTNNIQNEQTCWTCGKQGHVSRDCFMKGKGKGWQQQGKGKATHKGSWQQNEAAYKGGWQPNEGTYKGGWQQSEGVKGWQKGWQVKAKGKGKSGKGAKGINVVTEDWEEEEQREPEAESGDFCFNLLTESNWAKGEITEVKNKYAALEEDNAQQSGSDKDEDIGEGGSTIRQCEPPVTEPKGSNSSSGKRKMPRFKPKRASQSTVKHIQPGCGTRRVLSLSNEDHDKPIMQMKESETQSQWKRIEAAIDSGAVDIVANPKDFPGVEVEATEESRSGEHWVCAGGKRIPKLGRFKIEWWTNDGMKKRTTAQAGSVQKTLISVSKLNEAGYEAHLTKNRPRLINVKSREVIELKKKGGMFILDMWVHIPTDKKEAPGF